MPEVIHFAHRDGRFDDRTINDENWKKGPPEVFPDGGRAYADLSEDERRTAWRRWLEDGHDLENLGQAWALVDRARSRLSGPSHQRAAAPQVQGANGVYESTFAVLDDGIERIAVTRQVGGVDRSVVITLDPRQLGMGPPDARGVYDPAFGARPVHDQRQLWTDYLAVYELPPTPAMRSARRWYETRLGWVDHPAGSPRFEKALAALGVEYESRPAAMWSTLLAGLFAGLGGGGVFGLMWTFGEVGALPLPPGDLTATVTTDGIGSNTLVVAWTRAGVGSVATGYVVAVTPLAGGGAPTVWTSTGLETSLILTDVAVGTWLVEVKAFDGAAASVAASTTVLVPTRNPAPVQVPAAPVGVALQTVNGLRTVLVDWSPESSPGREPVEYRVRLDGPAQPVNAAGDPVAAIGADVRVGPNTYWSVGGLVVGTYTATVTASNALGTGAPATSLPLVLATLPTPGRVTGLAARVGRSSTTGRSAVRLTWSTATDQQAVAGYVVRLTSSDGAVLPAQIVPTSPAVFDPLDDDTWTVEVNAYNVDTDGPSVSLEVLVDHDAIDPNGIDWTARFGPGQVTAWADLPVQLASMDEQTQFWPHVLDVLTDAKGAHGGLADLPTQYFVAKLLTMWISLPADPTDPTKIPELATRLAAACSPPFPTTPPAAGAAGYDGDPLALWKAARTLRNASGTTATVLRYKLFAVAVALERYLGGNH